MKKQAEIGMFAMLTSVVVSILRIVFNVTKSGENLTAALERKTAQYVYDVSLAQGDADVELLEKTNERLKLNGEPEITMEEMRKRMQSIAARK